MQMLKQKKNKINIRKIKKSHICLFGSLLVILGIFLLSYNHIMQLKINLFSDMKLAQSDNKNIEEIIDNLPDAMELKKEEVKPSQETPVQDEKKEYTVDYSKYLGVLEIPRISLKRGFYGTDSKYNNINYNVTVVGGSTIPDVLKGNLILMAHSGDAYISYFAYLYLLKIGDYAYVTYQGTTYKYQIVNIYNIPKNGTATINRNLDKTTLTLITCTKNSDTEQTIYILERI